MKKVLLEQGTPEWLAWRAGGVGASESSAILGLNPWETVDSLRAKRLAPAGDGGNEHTRRGHKLEPVARSLYEALMGWEATPCCGEHDEFPWLRASFDGLRADGRLVVEIKAPSLKWHNHVLEEGVPDWYYCQVQHQLLVSGAVLGHFVSYCEHRGLSHGERLVVLPVEADPVLQKHLLGACRLFWESIRPGEVGH